MADEKHPQFIGVKHQLHLGEKLVVNSTQPTTGQQVVLEGETFYQIANYDRMRPFFMSIVSGGDHWMFISSTGALTAGRGNPDLALFPYTTDDKIHDSAEITGSKTVFVVQSKGRHELWEPFSNRQSGIYQIRRNIYKSFVGNKLVFEEINESFGLTFRYSWFNSERYGFVRKAWLINSNSRAVSVRLLDGFQNLMPCGIGSQFQNDKSTLLDAYKRSELEPDTGLGLFRLSSIPVDRPEPAEALKTTSAFALGLNPTARLLSSVQLDRFRRGETVQEETDVRGERGAYLVQAKLSVPARGSAAWMLVADVNRGPCEIAELQMQLRRPARLRRQIETDIARGTEELQRIVASADGLQISADALGNARHFANVLFNSMRGGVFNDGYQVDVADLHDFIRGANRDVAARQSRCFRQLKDKITYTNLLSRAAATNDLQLERLCHEYLPLTFSRRHGDPSRPWNRFSIPARKPDGSRVIGYEGNWRDIFQNWEALAVSYPDYVASMICKFVNASTVDGYNPYRITRDGIDWEVVEPHDPWSFIGYWGDHQVIYLLRLLEILERHEPEKLRSLLTRKMFCYSNVPYRIKPYEAVLENPKDTVVFDHELAATVASRVKERGSDGKLVWGKDDEARLVNLTEKLLVSLLAKLSNFIPGAGIWLNTQRPEWNDANNAIVGNGASMVTVYYLRRMLTFCLEVFGSTTDAEFTISSEVGKHFSAVQRVLKREKWTETKCSSGIDRKRVIDQLGHAAGHYREQIYTRGFSGEQQKLTRRVLVDFFAVARDMIDATIRENRRAEGLYHSYNLIRRNRPREINIRRLYEMLEGQVAVLSSGFLSPEESLAVLTALKHSSMYRPDQHSYLLYPNRQLPRYTERNNIAARELRSCRLLRQLVSDGNRELVERDVSGKIHFNASISNARDVQRKLEKLAATKYSALAKRDGDLVLKIFERLFDHESFTGRSGTFFGYEGLGCIYWHMVSKLLLAAQETWINAVTANAPKLGLKKLADCYHDIRAGIGDRKSPLSYGGFPTDPYSHTPAHAGARQPGLTGQVKEDVLCRFGELGVVIKNGEIHFGRGLLRSEEFGTKQKEFFYYDVNGVKKRGLLKPGEIFFTYCQVPVVLRRGPRASLLVVRFNGIKQQSQELRLDAATSREVLGRTGEIARIEVCQKSI